MPILLTWTVVHYGRMVEKLGAMATFHVEINGWTNEYVFYLFILFRIMLT